MDRLLQFVALVLFVCVALGSVGFVGASSSFQEADNLINTTESPNYASPSAEERSREEYRRVTVDVGGAVAVGTERLRGEFAQRTFDQRFDSVDDPDRRLAIVEQAIDAVGTQIDALDERQARSYTAYSDGTASAAVLLRETVRLNEAGQQQTELLQHIRERARSAPEVSTGVEFEIQLANFNGETVLLPSPIVEQIKPALTGAEESQSLYLQSGGDGLVLATMAGGEFLRQATLRGEQEQSGVDQFSLGGDARIVSAFERGEELYPWVFENAIGNPSISGFGDTPVYVITADHPQGEFVTYLDGTTTNPFREHQTKRPDAVPVTDVRTTGTERLNLTVEVTDPTGPMRVRLTNEETGSPVAGDVLVDGQHVGSTGPDGELWTIQPTGEFRLSVTTSDGETAAVTIS